MIKENELYQPIKDFFQNAGYEVYGEVKSIDIIAKKNEDFIAIELKTKLSTKLIYQGIMRQKLIDTVYLGIIKTKNTKKDNKLFSEKLEILKRLGLGLILVDFSYKKPYALVELEPSLVSIKNLQSRNKKKLNGVLKELNERSGSYNKGGSKGKTVTAYREKVLRVLSFMSDGSDYSSKEIETALSLDKINSILYRDFYGWFEKVDKGRYKASKKGIEALKEYDYIIKYIG